MNYPSIGQYTETIKLAARAPKDYFDKLSNLSPVLDSNGEPIMSSGNFAVVFKMYDPKKCKYYALKCFHRDQEGRMQNYQKISEELNRELSRIDFGTQNISSNYLVHVQYYEKELYVDINSATSLFPVLLMEWVDGITLDKCILQNINNTKLLHAIAYRFSRLARWLLTQRFAHGDLKPDNILVTKDYRLVLVDYDGMFVPSMKGQQSKELGSPNFRHPMRSECDFNEHIDDFPIVSIILSLKAISLNPHLFSHFITGDKFLFEEKDYVSMSNNKILPILNTLLYDKELSMILGSFLIMLNSPVFPSNLSSTINIQQSINTNVKTYSSNEAKEKIDLFFKRIALDPILIVYLVSDLFSPKLRQYWIPQNLWSTFQVNPIWWDKETYNSLYRWAVKYDAIQYSVIGEFSKRSRPDIIKAFDVIENKKYDYYVDYTFNILSELGVIDNFVGNIEKLTEIIKQDNNYTYSFKKLNNENNNSINSIDDLPF